MKINPTQLHAVRPLQPGLATQEQQLESAKEVRDAFRDFVGESFFGQMLKAMRSTVGKPAYFHGGRAEEVFRGQLDQTMAEQLTKVSADQIADPMFRQQFPQQAELLKAAEEERNDSMSELLNLRRR